MQTIYHVTEQNIAIAGPFFTWSDAKAWMVEHSSGDRIERSEDPTVEPSYESNPEPQEMTASCPRQSAR